MRLNNKGYMLVEIILACALAMVITYFITDLTIKLKNKNDDLLVKTLVSTDQGIIYNTIMKDLYYDSSSFSCSDITISGNSFTYGDFTNVISEYVSEITYDASSNCVITDDKITINIGLDVKQLSDENFDVNIEFKKNTP